MRTFRHAPRLLLFLFGTLCLTPGSAAGVRAQNADGPPAVTELGLWNQGTRLRGANIWLKKKGDRITPSYKRADFCRLAARGANYVNISHPGIYGEKPRGRERRYEKDEASLSSLKSLVDEAAAAGLYVVIAYRTGPGRNEDIFHEEKPPSKVWDNEDGAWGAWETMWRETAAEFARRPNVIGYDLMVEPETGDRPALWNSLAATIIPAVAAADPLTPILVEPADWGSAGGLAHLDLPRLNPGGKYPLVYAVHQYVPDAYAQQAEGRSYKCGKSGGDAPKWKQYVAYSCERREALESVYNLIAAWKREKNVPVAVNEFGVVRWAGGWSGDKKRGKPVPDADQFMAHQLRLIEALGANHALWMWYPGECVGDDDFDFTHGQAFENHTEVESALDRVIRCNWRLNEDRPSQPSVCDPAPPAELKCDGPVVGVCRPPAPPGR